MRVGPCYGNPDLIAPGELVVGVLFKSAGAPLYPWQLRMCECVLSNDACSLLYCAVR